MQMQVKVDTAGCGPRTAPPGWGTHFRMPLFRPGTQVRRQGRWETVDYVKLRRQEISVYLVGHSEPASARELELAPTLFTTVRVPALENCGYSASL